MYIFHMWRSRTYSGIFVICLILTIKIVISEITNLFLVLSVISTQCNIISSHLFIFLVLVLYNDSELIKTINIQLILIMC